MSALFTALVESETKEDLAAMVVQLRSVINTMNAVVDHQTDRLPWMQRQSSEFGIRMRAHPLTCGKDSGHTPLFPYYNKEREKVVLVCRDCDYVQDNSAGH